MSRVALLCCSYRFSANASNSFCSCRVLGSVLIAPLVFDFALGLIVFSSSVLFALYSSLMSCAISRTASPCVVVVRSAFRSPVVRFADRVATGDELSPAAGETGSPVVRFADRVATFDILPCAFVLLISREVFSVLSASPAEWHAIEYRARLSAADPQTAPAVLRP